MKIVLMEPLNVSEEYLQILAKPLMDQGHELTIYPEKTLDFEEMYHRSKDADIIIIANTPLPKEVVDRLTRTKLINVAFTGVDHVAVEAAKEKEILVANASGYAENAVVELTLGLNLALYRQILTSDKDTRKAEGFPGPIQGQEISGKTVGVVGTGGIGQKVAQMYLSLGAKVIAYNRTEKHELSELGIKYVLLDEIARQADIVTVHLPLNDATRGIISRDFFEKMKPSAVLINVARGPIVDNFALAEALNTNMIAGAGIDVYDIEPPLPEDYPLLQTKNIVLTPHIAYLTDEAMQARASIVFKNIEKYLQGTPSNLV